MLFNVLLDAAVVVSVPTDKEIYFLDVSWLEACASGNKALETDFPRQQVSYNPTCDTIYSTAMGNVREISRGLRRVRSTGADDVADPSLTAALAGRPLSRAASDPPPVVPVAPVADIEPHISPPLSEGIFTGLVLGMAGWPHDKEAQIVEQICSNGGSVAHEIGNALMAGKPNMCLCWGNGPPVFATPAKVPLVTVQWLQACIAEQTLHPSSAFPHFEPGNHPMPLPSMSKFVIRITGLQQDRKSSRERWRLEELVQVLGATVAQQNTRRSELTHIVCAEPSLLQSSFAELAAKRQIPLVSVQWLLDSFRLGSLQPEEKYGISGNGINGISSSSDVSASATGGPVACFTAVLAKCDILLSKTTLANTPDLQKMAKDLAAASVETWKTADELRNCLQARREGQVVIVVDKDEAHRNGLESIAANLSERQSFVQPIWLSETYSQRRRLPVESFGVFVTEDVQEPRPAQGASYAWQPAEMKRLEEVSEQAHHEKESKTGGSLTLLNALKAGAEQKLAKLGS